MKNNQFFYFLSYLIVLLAILFAGEFYKKYQIDISQQEEYQSIANTLYREVDTLTKEKSNATLAIALALTQNSNIHSILKNHQSVSEYLHHFSLTLRNETDFKNVWIQLVDDQGVSLARSWTPKHGDNLSKIRADVRLMNDHPTIRTSISVGHFDMTFKARVPIFDKDKSYLGFIETITHFNSIAKKIKEEGYDAVIVVDKRYKKQITKPFTQLFVGEHYIANMNANPKLLQLIENNGIKQLTSPHAKYIVDEKSKQLVINYNFLDVENKNMANFLIFKPISQLPQTKSQAIKTTTNLIVVIISMIAGLFIFLIGRSKKGVDVSFDMQTSLHTIVFFLGVLLLGSGLYYLLLTQLFNFTRQQYIQEYTNTIVKDYKIIKKKYTAISDTYYKTVINKPEVLQIVEKAYQADAKKQTKLRQQLQQRLLASYKLFAEYHIQQLHFYFPNNHSFLRFNHSEKFGDDLTKIRKTVSWVNANQRKTEGFEIGKTFSSYRYVFPLLYVDEKGVSHHVGSVETVFSPFAIINEFIESYGSKVSFIVNKSIVDKNFNSEILKHYDSSIFPNFYCDKQLRLQLQQTQCLLTEDLISNKNRQQINQQLLAGQAFSILGKDKNTILTLLPIHNPVSEEVESVIILQHDNQVVGQYYQNYILLLVSGIILLFIFLLYLYTHVLSKKKQKILDSQEAILVVTNKNRVIETNSKLLSFFGYRNMEKFLQDTSCVCERFIVKKPYYYKKTISENWIDSLLKLPEKERIVLMSDLNNIEYSFTVSIKSFGNNFLATFTDISDTVSAHLALKEKATRDPLTGAYNREITQTKINEIIEKKLIPGEKLGMVLLDIDYFKKVNDTYGHNIGDKTLCTFVKIINKSIRSHDICIRWGGEEFIIIAIVPSQKELTLFAEKLRKEIANSHFEDVNTITCSFGLTLYHDNEPLIQAVERADKALYIAKENGRNQIQTVW